MSLSFVTKPNQKSSKRCPVCSNFMIENHFKDLVCHCTGKCLDLSSLEKLYSKNTPIANRIASIHKFKELHEPVIIKVENGYNTVARAKNLASKGFSWSATNQYFYKQYKERQDANSDITFLEDLGYAYSVNKG